MKTKKNWLICCSLLLAVAILITPLQAQAATVKKRALVPTPKLNYSGIFDATYYANTYPDIALAFGDNKELMLNHYLTYGIAEKRRGTDKLPERYISTYTTSYNAKIPRATNVLLAATNLNSTILNPGDVFSYNDTVGPRTQAAGFVEAPIYINGVEAVGIGGGICQVSSTLYAALLLAHIPVIERHQHSLPVHYLPDGMDATVSYGSLDLKFMNPYPFPIAIVVVADSGTLTVSIMRYES